MCPTTDGEPTAPDLTSADRADAAEERKMRELDVIVNKSVFSHLAEGQVTVDDPWDIRRQHPGKYFNMGADPRLPAMPKQPTLLDYFRCRFVGANHLLQSAALAMKAGHSDNVVLACLLHDVAVVGFIRCDHGYWGAQMIGPYVDEEVSEAIRLHQALRFFPDEAFGYEYPQMYVELFGPDYEPEQFIVDEYRRARNSRYYEQSRLICVNDVYAFDPTVQIDIGQFEDVIGRCFRQPAEGLGLDCSPSAHMWRTIMWPNRFI
jgi:hypothetical protein